MKAWREIFIQWWFWPVAFVYSAVMMARRVMLDGGITWPIATGITIGCLLMVMFFSSFYWWVKKE